MANVQDRHSGSRKEGFAVDGGGQWVFFESRDEAESAAKAMLPTVFPAEPSSVYVFAVTQYKVDDRG